MLGIDGTVETLGVSCAMICVNWKLEASLYQLGNRD